MEVQRYLHLLDRIEVFAASAKGSRERIVMSMESGRRLIGSFTSSPPLLTRADSAAF